MKREIKSRTTKYDSKAKTKLKKTEGVANPKKKATKPKQGKKKATEDAQKEWGFEK